MQLRRAAGRSALVGVERYQREVATLKTRRRPYVERAIQAARRLSIPVTLVGPQEVLRAELARHPFAGSLPHSVCHASEVIPLEDKAVQAVRAKRDSPTRVGLRLGRNGDAAAF